MKNKSAINIQIMIESRLPESEIDNNCSFRLYCCIVNYMRNVHIPKSLSINFTIEQVQVIPVSKLKKELGMRAYTLNEFIDLIQSAGLKVIQ